MEGHGAATRTDSSSLHTGGCPDARGGAKPAATIAQAEGGDSFSKSVVAALFGLPGGPFLVGLVGVALVAAGGYAVVHGLRAATSCTTSPSRPASAQW